MPAAQPQLPLAWYTANLPARTAVITLTTLFANPLTAVVPAAAVDTPFVVAYPLGFQAAIDAWRAGWALRAEEVEVDGVMLLAYVRLQIVWLPDWYQLVLSGDIDPTDVTSIACLQQVDRYAPDAQPCQDLLATTAP